MFSFAFFFLGVNTTNKNKRKINQIIESRKKEFSSGFEIVSRIRLTSYPDAILIMSVEGNPEAKKSLWESSRIFPSDLLECRCMDKTRPVDSI